MDFLVVPTINFRQRPSDEAKPVDVLLAVGEVIGPAAPSRRRRKQPTVAIQSNVLYARPRLEPVGRE